MTEKLTQNCLMDAPCDERYQYQHCTGSFCTKRGLNQHFRSSLPANNSQNTQLKEPPDKNMETNENISEEEVISLHAFTWGELDCTTFTTLVEIIYERIVY